MTYYLISEEALVQEMKDFRNALIQEDNMRQGKAVVIALTAYTRALKATRRDVTVDHDPETDTYQVMDTNLPAKLAQQAAEHIKESV